MVLPQEFIQSLQGIAGFDEQSFIAVHEADESVTSVRFNPSKFPGEISKWPVRLAPNNAIELLQVSTQVVPWAQYGYYLSIRPSFTFDPLFHAGCYYVQEASGMFLEEALKQTVDLTKKLKVLDLCASPGGKSTHLQSLISPQSILVSNEVIKSRSATLRENVIRWGAGNIVVTANDPADFEQLPGYFDVMVVDAPCSASGLFRRDEETIPFWSPGQVEHCALRQKRILTDAWRALKNEGVLIYCTCSFSREEDEAILHWLKSKFSVSSLRLNVQEDWNIIETEDAPGTWGYRFWPHKLKGEGFFMACFRKLEDEEANIFRSKKHNDGLTVKEQAIIHQWVQKTNIKYFKQDKLIIAFPDSLEQEFKFLYQQLKVIYSGVSVGEIVHDKLIPQHSLAMSKWIDESVPEVDADYEAAIAYLQRKDGIRQPATTGWRLATYKRHHLGWINVLPNRINNYYPKEMRILKQR